MKPQFKFLIVLAVAVPVFVELRTIGGIFGYEVSLPVSVVAAVVAAIALVLIDEAVLSDGSLLKKGHND